MDAAKPGTPHAVTGSPTLHRRARWLLAVAGTTAACGALALVMIASGPDDKSAPGANPASPPAAKADGAKPNRSSLDQYEVARGDFEITTTATGDLRARNQIEIRNPLESETTIVEIVAEGTAVKKGDILVKLNAESIQQRLDEESLALETSRASVVEANEAFEIQLSENESSKRAGELKLALARLELDKWRQGEVESKKQELDHALDRAEKDEVRLKEYVDRSRLLFEREFYSKDKLKQDELNLEQAVAATEKARLAKKIYWDFEHPRDEKQKVSAVEEAEAEVERVLRQNASRIASKEADKKNKQSSLVIREQKFNKYKEQLDAATIKAPNDGLVVYSTSLDNARWGGDEGPLQVGSKCWPNQTLIVLPDTSEMIAAVKVHESLAGRIRKGQPATVKIDAMAEQRFTGTVESVGILAEQTNRWTDPTLREYTVKVALNIPKELLTTDRPAAAADGGSPPGTAGGGLRPSMRCEAEIVLGKVADAVTVPIQAVHSEGLLRYVHVADGSGTRYTRRPVLPGQRSDRFAEIRAGVNPGERVLLRKPEASEIVGKGTGSWDPQELAAVGLEVNASGDIVPTAAALAARAGGGGPGGGGGRGGPGGRGAKAEAPRPATGVVVTPAAAEDAGAAKPDDDGKPESVGGTKDGAEATVPAKS